MTAAASHVRRAAARDLSASLPEKKIRKSVRTGVRVKGEKETEEQPTGDKIYAVLTKNHNLACKYSHILENN
jgi:hypothetical protein